MSLFLSLLANILSLLCLIKKKEDKSFHVFSTFKLGNDGGSSWGRGRESVRMKVGQRCTINAYLYSHLASSLGLLIDIFILKDCFNYDFL